MSRWPETVFLRIDRNDVGAQYSDAAVWSNQSALSVDKPKAYASELALDRTRFDSAPDSGKFAEMVQRDIEEGMKLGINVTPTVFINGRRVSAEL